MKLKYLSVGIFVLFAMASNASAVNSLQDAHVVTLPDHERVVFDLTQRPDFTYFSLTKPDRLVIDFKASRLTSDLSKIAMSGDVVKEVRTSKSSRKGVLRIVVELTKTIKPRVFSLPPTGPYGDRLVVDFVKKQSTATIAKTANDAGNSMFDSLAELGHEDSLALQGSESTVSEAATIAKATTTTVAKAANDNKSPLRDIATAIDAGNSISYSLADLGQEGSLALQGSESKVSFSFGSRLDEIVLDASLDFIYTPSPALTARVSHMKIYLNEELMAVIPIQEGTQGTQVTENIALDPRFFRNSNQLQLELVGRIDSICFNPNSPSIWTEISQLTQLNFKTKRTILETDLAMLPAPFFDQRDYSSFSLPFVIPKGLNLQSIKAVGVAASYFGSLAKWRKVNLSVVTDVLPQQHAIVFATNKHKPYFIRNIPDVDRPTIQMITHPTNPYLKMLLILGKDSDDLHAAVQALALGGSLMTGNIAYVNEIKNIAPRKPYDAPNWIDTTRAISFAELVDSHHQLQAEGVKSQPIKVSFNLPPDLLSWQSRDIPLDLAYRYSPPIIDDSGSRLSVSINGQFVEAFTLSKSGRNSEDKRMRVPLLDDNILSTNSNVSLPAFRVGSKNKIAFEFGFASPNEDICQSSQPSKIFSVIDATSSMDFSGLPHYIKMPNMGAFASSGYPYTRLADLSETAILMKEQPSLSEIELFINVMAFMGKNSGLPGFKVTVTDNWNEEALANKDIIVLGTHKEKQGFNNSKQAYLAFKNMNRLLQRPAQSEKNKGNIWQQKDYSDTPVTDLINISASGPFASVVAFESPFTKTRTVTMLSAEQDSSLKLISEAIADEGKLPLMFGSIIAIQPNKLSSFEVGDVYYLGYLPLHKLIWFHFSEHPFLLGFIVFLIIALVTIFLWRMLKKVTERRLKGDS